MMGGEEMEGSGCSLNPLTLYPRPGLIATVYRPPLGVTKRHCLPRKGGS
jgi:hypothetical protein